MLWMLGALLAESRASGKGPLSLLSTARGREEWRSAGSAHRAGNRAGSKDRTPESRNDSLFALQTYISYKADHVYQSLVKQGSLQLTLPRGKPEIFHDRKCSTCKLERGLSSEEHLLLL